MNEKWIPWYGGEQPVSDETNVKVKYRDAVNQDVAFSAESFRWEHANPNNTYYNPDVDIMAYCVIENKDKKAMNEKYAQFIVMRNDMTSLNPGKAMAQAAHASSVMHENCDHELFHEWKNETIDGFGTCYVYEASMEDILYFKETIDAHVSNVWTKIVHDPTYPIKDGNILHQLPLNTCLVVFGPVDEIKSILKKHCIGYAQ